MRACRRIEVHTETIHIRTRRKVDVHTPRISGCENWLKVKLFDR